MRIFGWIISLALLSTTQIIGSQNACNRCYSYSCDPYDSCDTNCCSQTKFKGFIDYLYWRLCRGDLAIGDDHSHTRYTSPDFESGFRLGASYTCNCWDLGFRYTDFCWSKKRKFKEKKDGKFVINFPNSESNGDEPNGNNGYNQWENSHNKNFGKFHFDAQILDLELGSCNFLNCCCGTIRPFAGAKFAWVHEKHKTHEQDGRHQFCGYGLYLGGEGNLELFDWQFCDCCIPVSFVTRLSTGILHSKFRQKGKDHHQFYHKDRSREKECLFITVHELFAGVDFSYNEFCDFNADLSIGYEVQSWQGWREFNSKDDITSLGFGGLVVRLGVEF